MNESGRSPAAIAVAVNGETRAAEAGATVASFLIAHDIDPAVVVVELNGEIVTREAYRTTPLSDGDGLEIVHFVGGG